MEINGCIVPTFIMYYTFRPSQNRKRNVLNEIFSIYVEPCGLFK